MRMSRARQLKSVGDDVQVKEILSRNGLGLLLLISCNTFVFYVCPFDTTEKTRPTCSCLLSLCPNLSVNQPSTAPNALLPTTVTRTNCQPKSPIRRSMSRIHLPQTLYPHSSFFFFLSRLDDLPSAFSSLPPYHPVLSLFTCSVAKVSKRGR